MTVTVYGTEVACEDCGSSNLTERQRTEYTDYGGSYHYAVAVCQTCGWEVSL